MTPAFLSPADAAARLGVSAKALRLYEDRGLIAPGRTPAGWRAYGPVEMERAAEIVALRALGFSLSQVARVFAGEMQGLEQALAAHQATLENQLRATSGQIARIRSLRDDLASGRTPSATDLARLHAPAPQPAAVFDLPWPWGGERFELGELRALTWIIGPLFSGKTRLAQSIADALPGAAFVGLDRARPEINDATLTARAGKTLAWLVEDGAAPSPALLALLSWLDGDGALVIDLIEQDLDEPSQLALAAHLRRRGPGARPLIMLTRSSAMLDLSAVGPDETIILCPANHSQPVHVAPHPGAPGHEVVASCLGPPEVRARTEGVIAFRPPAA